MPMLRRSITCGEPRSECTASAQYDSSDAARSNRPSLLIDLERREARRRGERMSRVRVAVEQLDARRRQLFTTVS